MRNLTKNIDFQSIFLMGSSLNFCLWKFSLKYNISQRFSNYISERRNHEAGLVCNPAPLNGSAPNLVISETDSQGCVNYKRAFNTQVSIT